MNVANVSTVQRQLACCLCAYGEGTESTCVFAQNQTGLRTSCMVPIGPLRAAPLLRVIVKFTVKFPVCSKPKTHAYGVFDCEFDYDFQEWSCSDSSCVKSIPSICSKFWERLNTFFSRSLDLREQKQIFRSMTEGPQ